MVQKGIQEEENSVVYKKSKKRDCKALFLLHQGVDEVNFERISSANSAKEAWEILNQAHGGAGKGKNKEKGVSARHKIETGEVKQNEEQTRLLTEGVSEQQKGLKGNKGSEVKNVPEGLKKSAHGITVKVNPEKPREEIGNFSEIRVLKNSSVAITVMQILSCDQSEKQEDKQRSNFGEISEIRVFRKQSFAREDLEKSKARDVVKSGSKIRDVFGDLDYEEEDLGYAIQQDIEQHSNGSEHDGRMASWERETQKKKVKMLRISNEAKKEGDESSGSRVLRIGAARMKATSLRVEARRCWPRNRGVVRVEAMENGENRELQLGQSVVREKKNCYSGATHEGGSSKPPTTGSSQWKEAGPRRKDCISCSCQM